MNIQYRGAVYDVSGYAHLRTLFVYLSNKGFNVKIKPFRGQDNVSYIYQDECKKLETTKLKSPYVNIVSGIAPQLTIDSEAAYNIGYSMFETTEIPDKWIDFYNQFGEIWVPSTFCLKAFNRKDLRCTVNVVPFGIDTELFQPTPREKDHFTFLAVGQWIDRKGWDLLIRAYTAEFMGNYDVRLCIKTYEDTKTNTELIREYLEGGKPSSYMPRICIKNQKIDEGLMPCLYHEADCYIMPSRGEGFNLPALEAMACGVPVVTTDFGGHLDFLKEQYSWLIPVNTLKRLSERLCTINQGYKNLWFAEPDIKDIRKIMRYVYEHQTEAKEKGVMARKFVEENMTWDKISCIAENRLNEIFRAI